MTPRLRPVSVGTFCWHVHHDTLVEPLTGPLATRITYIKREKPPGEQALRLRLIKPVRGNLPTALIKAWAASVKAVAASVKALQDNMPALLALHAKECPDCPWDGKTIFSKSSGARP